MSNPNTNPDLDTSCQMYLKMNIWQGWNIFLKDDTHIAHHNKKLYYIS